MGPTIRTLSLNLDKGKIGLICPGSPIVFYQLQFMGKNQKEKMLGTKEAADNRKMS